MRQYSSQMRQLGRESETMADRKLKKGQEIRQFIINNVESHPHNIVPFAVDKLGVSRATINRYVSALVKEGLLEGVGSTRARRYALNDLVNKEFHIDLGKPNLAEDVILRETVFANLENVADNIQDILWSGANEMVNNVLDHSGAKNLWIGFGRTAATIWIRISDDGVGVFEKIRKECNLLDARHALLELSKGKLTTAKKYHSGEGIFFTSRMFSTFILDSRGLVFLRTMEDHDSWLFEDRKADEYVPGTSILMSINLNATHTTREIYDRFENDADPAGFAKTHVPVRLAKYPNEQLVSRSQARRVLARFENFSEVMLDFDGVPQIGQAFADEIFRVFANMHPEIKIVPIGMSADVEKMINHVRRLPEENKLLSIIKQT
jgi:anti-sigma regulatory factor (Ser/Thr protein kinase)